MGYLKKIFLVLALFCAPQFAVAKTVAIDGVSGYVGSAIVKDLEPTDLRIGYHEYDQPVAQDSNIYVGNICDPAYLRKLLKDVQLYYQIAAIASVKPRNTFEEYILTNSIAPYLASRINKTMTIVSLSSITNHDIEEDEFNGWIKKFVAHVRTYDARIQQLSKEQLESDLHNFIVANPTPTLKPNQFYGFSKLLLEKLLFKSARSRSGHVYLIRPAFVIGADVSKRCGDSVLKNIMQAMFEKDDKYVVYKGINYYTPINNLKAMMLYLGNSEHEFAKFGIFDAGWISMEQHEFVQRLFAISHQRPANIKLVDESGFEREVIMFKDARLREFYPTQADIDPAIEEMVQRYQD